MQVTDFLSGAVTVGYGRLRSAGYGYLPCKSMRLRWLRSDGARMRGMYVRIGMSTIGIPASMSHQTVTYRNRMIRNLNNRNLPTVTYRNRP